MANFKKIKVFCVVIIAMIILSSFDGNGDGTRMT